MTETESAAESIGENPLRDESHSVEIVSTSVPFEGRVWNIRRDVLRYGGGEIVRDYVDHTGAVAVFAVDEAERVLLIQQYRHPIGRREWEIPAGLLDIDGEDPLVAAQRELAEETDLRGSEWRVLQDFVTTPGGSNEQIRIYLAQRLSPTGTEFRREAEEADIVTRWVPFDEALAAVLRGDIQNPSAVIAILAYAAVRARGTDSLREATVEFPRIPRRGRRP